MDTNPEEIYLGEPEGEIHTVSMWVRLANNVLDQIVLSLILSLTQNLSHLFGYTIPQPYIFIKNQILPRDINWLGYGIIIGITLLYYFILEGLTARTIGKMITRTEVVNRYGEKPTWAEIALRTICRIIPLEAISFIPNGIGWHDRFSQTYVKQSDPIVRNF